MLQDMTRSQQVLDRLRGLVLSGVFEAGERLKEVELSERLEVSRTPVRDAMAALSSEGLLIYEPNRGYSVRAFGLEDLLAAFDVRATLEGMACRIVAEQGLSAAGAMVLDACMNECDDILARVEIDQSSVQRWYEVNAMFHSVLAEQSGNSYLVRSVRDTMRLPLIYDQRGVPHPPEQVRMQYGRAQIERGVQEHAQIMIAIRERQGARAEHLMREHFFVNREELRGNFDQLVLRPPYCLPPKGNAD
jgi:GntR family transcriptional regulator of vanillate catabolism